MLRQALLVVLMFCCTGSYQKSSPESTFYTAAVVEYSPVSEVGTDGMRGLVAKNVNNYIRFIEDAARQGADIIVFPEVGLISYGKPMYASLIPNPRDHVNPCTDNSAGMLEEIAQLSCAARSNDIYVVINFPEVKVCNESVPGSECIHNGTFYYNCDIVFDRSGYIVARYRKYNLFLEAEFSRTPTPEISSFETDFGVRFGVFTCFDILFKEPALSLVQQFNVTDVVVPQAWFSELPFLTALQAQSQWSFATDVNLLASGYSKPSVGSTGSGIYNGQNGPLVTIFSNLNTSKLLIANVTKRVAKGTDYPASITFDGNSLSSEYESSFEYLRNKNSDLERSACESNSIASEYANTGECAGSEDLVGSGQFSEGPSLMRENLTSYTTMPLETAQLDGTHEKNVSLQLCSGTLCCNFTVHTLFQQSGDRVPSENSHYRMVVYSGMRSYARAAEAGIQVCGIVMCRSEALSTCGLPPSGTNTFQPTFSHVSISGSFNASNAIQMPNALAVGYKVINPRSYMFTKNITQGGRVNVSLMTKVSISKLVTFGIYGRYFDDDVVHVE